MPIVTLVHTLDAQRSEFTSHRRVVFAARLPLVGEYLTFTAAPQVYQVQLVLHTPDAEEYFAELYAVEPTGDFAAQIEQMTITRLVL